MENPKIPISECQDILNRAREMLGDKKAYELNSGNKLTRIMLKFAERRGYLTQKQINELERVCSYYEGIKEINSVYEPSIRDSILDIFGRVVSTAIQYAPGNRGISTRIQWVNERASQIKEGQYFWEKHFWPAKGLLKELKEEGIAVNGLEKEVEDMKKQLGFQIITVREE